MNPELFFGHTDTGKQRDNNEDAFIAENVMGGKYIAACVIDGVGGYEGGEVAAAIAKETILNKLNSGTGDPIPIMKEAFFEANKKIYDERLANSQRDSMACVLTLSLADLAANQFHYAHVGDTRLYLFRDHSLVKLSHDHSFVGFLEDNKKISEEEAMRHPKRNEINKALGFDPNMSSVTDYVETGTSPFLPGDILLLCSDGLSDMVDSQAIISILSTSKDLGQKTKSLIDAANNAGGKDNITVVLVHNNKKPTQQRATKPKLIKKKRVPNESFEEEIKDTPVVLVKKTGGGTIAFLIILCLLLGAAVFYLWNYPRQSKTEVQPTQPAASVVTVQKRNAGEQKFIDSLQSLKTVSLSDSVYGKLVLTDSIAIKKDSLHIIGNGVTLVSDSLYSGAAFIVDSSCKYLLIENLALQNFDIGIVSRGHSILFRNVRFLNCRLPLQSNFLFPQSLFVNGRVIDSLLFQTDSLVKKQK